MLPSGNIVCPLATWVVVELVRDDKLEPFVYAVDRTENGVTGHAGLPVAIEAFHALGVSHLAAGLLTECLAARTALARLATG